MKKGGTGPHKTIRETNLLYEGLNLYVFHGIHMELGATL